MPQILLSPFLAITKNGICHGFNDDVFVMTSDGFAIPKHDIRKLFETTTDKEFVFPPNLKVIDTNAFRSNDAVFPAKITCLNPIDIRYHAHSCLTNLPLKELELQGDISQYHINPFAFYQWPNIIVPDKIIPNNCIQQENIECWKSKTDNSTKQKDGSFNYLMNKEDFVINNVAGKIKITPETLKQLGWKQNQHLYVSTQNPQAIEVEFNGFQKPPYTLICNHKSKALVKYVDCLFKFNVNVASHSKINIDDNMYSKLLFNKCSGLIKINYHQADIPALVKINNYCQLTKTSQFANYPVELYDKQIQKLTKAVEKMTAPTPEIKINKKDFFDLTPYCEISPKGICKGFKKNIDKTTLQKICEHDKFTFDETVKSTSYGAFTDEPKKDNPLTKLGFSLKGTILLPKTYDSFSTCDFSNCKIIVSAPSFKNRNEWGLFHTCVAQNCLEWEIQGDYNGQDSNSVTNTLSKADLNFNFTKPPLKPNQISFNLADYENWNNQPAKVFQCLNYHNQKEVIIDALEYTPEEINEVQKICINIFNSQDIPKKITFKNFKHIEKVEFPQGCYSNGTFNKKIDVVFDNCSFTKPDIKQEFSSISYYHQPFNLHTSEQINSIKFKHCSQIDENMKQQPVQIFASYLNYEKVNFDKVTGDNDFALFVMPQDAKPIMSNFKKHQPSKTVDNTKISQEH